MTSKRQPQSPVQQLDSLRRVLEEKRRSGIPLTGKPTPWREIAKDYPGCPPGTLCAVSKGRDPRKPAIRAALGLPVLASVPICPKHGIVHVSRRCPPEAVPGPRPKRRDWRGLCLTLAGVLANVKL